MKVAWFIPVHREHDNELAYVTVDHIVAVEPSSAGGAIVNMSNGAPYRVTETVQEVLEMIPSDDGQ